MSVKIPPPARDELERLHFKELLNQLKIAEIYGVSKSTVCQWFLDVGLKGTRAKHNQRGSNNSTWRGDNVTYSAFHSRVIALKGKPKECEVCGTTEAKIYDWACIGDYKNVEDFKRMCRSCHWKHDNTGNNFDNNTRQPGRSSQAVPRKSQYKKYQKA